MRHRLPLLVIGLLMLTSSCTSGGSDDGPLKADYTPIPDEELYSAIAAIPGVERSDVSLNDAFPDYAYVGEVDISPDADAQDVLDTVYAKLRQGRFRAAINITGYQSGRDVRLTALKRSGSPSELTQRYGPQPGDGTPPGD